MKISLLLTPLLFAASSYSIGYEELLAQKKVTLNANQLQLGKIFKEIENQTKLTFFFSNNCVDITKTASINVKDETLENVLNTLISNKYTYVLKDNYIVVSEKQNQQPQKNTKKIVEGTVKDKKGEPLIGVNIIVKGTKIGSTTNET